MAAANQKVKTAPLRPILKWVGGKTQLLPEILPKIPLSYNKYIEPFFGGGALFFAHKPENSIIADSNPELVNLYQSVADDVQTVISYLRLLENKEEVFYKVRAIDWTTLPKCEAAARTIFLNRTCFNGLYRVNKKGGFNVPFGRYKNPKILDEETLHSASEMLKRSTIICGDYKAVLSEHAKPGDFIFLDPPYLPISEYKDFKRYTKEQFYEEDHEDLAKEVIRLQEMGCHIILTNSNHPLVHEQYGKFKVEVIQTKRYISCNGKTRTGEDVIVDILPKPLFNLKIAPKSLPPQALLYPPTRYMGSKNKLLERIWALASQFEFETALDLFSGSGIVGYMFKAQGKTVLSNDYMSMGATFTKAMVENNSVTLSNKEALSLLEPCTSDKFVENTFQGLYFSDEDNKIIDTIRANIKKLKDKYKVAIATSALIRACLKKRPRGIFTYVGFKYDDGRKDLQTSFENQFLDAITLINKAVFSNNKKNKSRHGDAMTVLPVEGKCLVYIDPPYYSPLSDNEYVRRYHFVEGIARDWKEVEIQDHTITKKFKSYPTPFSSRNGAYDAFNQLFKRFRENIIMVSYSSNSLPTLDEMVALLSKYKNHVEVVPIDYKYSFGNQGAKVGNNKNDVQEYIFIGY